MSIHVSRKLITQSILIMTSILFASLSINAHGAAESDAAFKAQYRSHLAIVAVVQFANTSEPGQVTEASLLKLIEELDGAESEEFWLRFANDALNLASLVWTLELRREDEALITSLGIAVKRVCQSPEPSLEDLSDLLRHSHDGTRGFIRETLIMNGYSIDADLKVTKRLK